jgi:plastocyanin
MQSRSRARSARSSALGWRRTALALLLAAGASVAHAAGKLHTVTIEGMKFAPERLEVSVGDRVTWVNKDFVPHTVTASKAGVESGVIAANGKWTFTAKRPGEMPYICRLHPTMQGVLAVK